MKVDRRLSAAGSVTSCTILIIASENQIDMSVKMVRDAPL